MATTPRKYIRTASPALLTEPLDVHLDSSALAQLNDYRQAQHAWLACAGDADERTRLREMMERVGALLALQIAIQAAHQMGEPSDWAADELKTLPLSRPNSGIDANPLADSPGPVSLSDPAAAKVEVTVRSNEGEDKTVPASDVAEAIRIAKKLTTPENYMVCIVQNGVRTLRWDRATTTHENQWCEEEPDAFQRIGSAASLSEDRALKEQWLAESWLDNQVYADGLNAQIAEEAIRLAPAVREAIINVYEGLGINSMLNLIRKAPLLPETYHEYKSLEKRLRPLDPSNNPFSFATECCGIKHPSADLSSTVQEQLKERGFKDYDVVWCDARGVRIEQWAWLEGDNILCDETNDYGWYDPAGIQEIYETYADAISKLQREALPTVRAFEKNYGHGWDAYRDGQPMSACADPDSLEGSGWTSGWQGAYKRRIDLPYKQLQILRASGLVEEISFDQIPFRSRSDKGV